MIKKILFTGLLAVAIGGCDNATSPSGDPPKPSPPPAAVSAKPRLNDKEINQALAIKPEYEIAIEESKTEPKQYAVTWSAKVNTGGWAMTTDSVLVEESNRAMACRIWVTIEQPAPGEMVTQATETLRGRHDAGDAKIERVEFSVRRHIRGVDFGGPATYAVVKSIKYPY